MYYDLLEAFNQGRLDYRHDTRSTPDECLAEIFDGPFEHHAYYTGAAYEQENGDTDLVDRVWKGRGDTVLVQEGKGLSLQRTSPPVSVYHVDIKKCFAYRHIPESDAQ
jgi:hypothetical protein